MGDTQQVAAFATLREPEPGETPLSDEEKLHALKKRIAWTEEDEIDRFPLVRRWLPVGSWGITTPGLRRATPFDGLLT